MKKKTPTYIQEKHPLLAGIFVEIPCNRKARRLQGKLDKKFYPATIKPIIKRDNKYWRTK